MKLLTKEILSKVHPLYADKGGSDPLIVAKYFDPINEHRISDVTQGRVQ